MNTIWSIRAPKVFTLSLPRILSNLACTTSSVSSSSCAVLRKLYASSYMVSPRTFTQRCWRKRTRAETLPRPFSGVGALERVRSARILAEGLDFVLLDRGGVLTGVEGVNAVWGSGAGWTMTFSFSLFFLAGLGGRAAGFSSSSSSFSESSSIVESSPSSSSSSAIPSAFIRRSPSLSSSTSSSSSSSSVSGLHCLKVSFRSSHLIVAFISSASSSASLSPRTFSVSLSSALTPANSSSDPSKSTSPSLSLKSELSSPFASSLGGISFAFSMTATPLAPLAAAPTILSASKSAGLTFLLGMGGPLRAETLSLRLPPRSDSMGCTLLM
mmetsp:Transcript_5658/g.10238  ORF Transcript_5658/g.10238 Transcript_5658/m.10238 type:complete len:327 (-) Transcript_5658:3479-4459(-)